MTAQQRILSDRLLRRCRLLDAARGILGKAKEETPPLPTFPLQKHHFGDFSSATPTDFHNKLCHMIQNADERVYIASLYVGPAVGTTHPKEEELMQALTHVSNKHNDDSENDCKVDIKVVLDQNRALRPVPASLDDKKTTTSSAQAVAEAIQQNVHLFKKIQKPLANNYKDDRTEMSVFKTKTRTPQDLWPVR